MTNSTPSMGPVTDRLSHVPKPRRPPHKKAPTAVLLASLLLFPWISSSPAQEDSGSSQETPAAIARFAGTYWSQIYPSRDYDRGCAIGFLSFEFQPTGYFIFNRKITGSWRIDELGNLKLRTKQGETLKLIVNNDTLQATSDLGIVKRANLYQKCPA